MSAARAAPGVSGMLLACLAAASGCTAGGGAPATLARPACAQEPAVDAARAGLASAEPVVLAAAARDSVAAHATELVPAITSALERLTEPGGDAGERWACQFLIDALIQLGARAEPELLNALRSRVPATPLLVLAAREPRRHLEFLEWAACNCPDDDEWHAANELLAEHAPERAARQALSVVRPQLWLDVMDDARLSLSENAELSIGCGRTPIPTAYRPLPRHALTRAQPGVAVEGRLTRGPAGFAVQRTLAEGAYLSSCESPLDRRATSLELLRWMLDVPERTRWPRPSTHWTLVLEDDESFVLEAEGAIEFVREQWQVLRDALVARGWITRAEFEALAGLEVAVRDYRFDRRPSPPSVSGAADAIRPPVAAKPTLAPGFPRPMKSAD